MKIRKKAITLLEIMIVIVIIGVISSVIGFNMKGSLDAGRSFATERGSKEVHDILTMKQAQGVSVDEMKENLLTYLEENEFVSTPKKLTKDGWKEEYQIVPLGKGEFCVYSQHWRDYLSKKKHMTLEQMVEEYPWAFSPLIDDILQPEGEREEDEAKS